MVRPIEAVPEAMAEEILDWLAQGKPLREFCRLEGKPSWRTVYAWLEKDPAFFERFARARDIGADAIAQDALDILDSEPERGEDGRRDSAHVAWLKNRAEMRLKLLAKWNPKKYGEKLTAEISEDRTVRIVLQDHRKKIAADEGSGTLLEHDPE